MSEKKGKKAFIAFGQPAAVETIPTKPLGRKPGPKTAGLKSEEFGQELQAERAALQAEITALQSDLAKLKSERTRVRSQLKSLGVQQKALDLEASPPKTKAVETLEHYHPVLAPLVTGQAILQCQLKLWSQLLRLS